MNDKLKQKTVLIIEDEAAIRQSYADFLEDEGYKVLKAENGLVGLKVFEREQVDFVMVDLRMPQMDGLQVLAKIKEISPETPTIVVSGTGVIRDAVEALHQGAWDYLLKPITDFSILLYSIENVLEKARLVKENKEYQKNLERMVEERTAKIKKFRTISDNAVHGNMILDLQGNIIYVNAYCSKLHGYTIDELIGQPISIFNNKNDNDNFCQISRLLDEIKNCDPIEVVHLHKKGTKIPLLISGTMIMDEQGQPEYLAISGIDISKIKQAEKKLAESEERFRSIFEQAAVGIAHVSIDGQFMLINKRFCDIVEYSVEEMLKKTFFDIYHSDEKGIDLRNLKKLRAGEIECYKSEKRCFKKDGSFVWVNLTVSVAHDSSDRPDYFIAVIEDISERKKTEEELIEQKFRFMELFNNMKSGVVVYEAINDGEEFLIKDINKAGLRLVVLRREQEVIGRAVTDIFTGVKEFGLFAIFQKVWKTGIPQFMPAAEYRSSDLNRWYENYVYKLPSGEVVAIFSDMTDSMKAEEERQNLQKQFMQSQKMEAVGTIASGIAHNFNNILSVIFGRTEMAMAGIPPESRIYKDLEQVISSVEVATQLTHQMLSFSRTHEQEFFKTEIYPIISESLNMFKASISNGIEIRENIDQNSGKALVDPNQMQHVMLNVFNNAYQSLNSSNGIIEVGLAAIVVDADFAAKHANLNEGEYIKISVIDNGHGMDEETSEHIFEPFFTTKEEGQGTGLGLSMVHGIITGCGGTIILQSELGKGTKFEIYLPQIKDQ